MNNDDEVEELENVDDSTEDELGKALDEERNRDKSKIEQEARKKVNETAKKGMRKLKGSLFKSVGGSVFSVVASVVIVIFMSIGIISYIVAMPGFVQQKMTALVEGFAKDVKNWWSGENSFLNDPNSNDPEFVDAKLGLLQYLDNMGLNPIGMGFVAYAARDNNNKIINYISDFMTEGEMTTLTGSYSNGDLLYKYIVASERTYVLNDDGMRGLLGLAPKTDFKGMLSFVTDMGSKFFGNIAVDRGTKSLTITETSLFGKKEQKFTFDLDSWVGRYGKPIEFLLALHISTMSPDITEEFIDNPDLQTNVQIKVEREEYAADYSVSFKDENGNMQESPVKLGKTGADSDRDRLYEVAMRHLKVQENGDGTVEFKYENTNDINAEDITISALYELITEMNPENKQGYVAPEENKEIDECINWGIDRFIGSRNEDGSARYADYYMVQTTSGTYGDFQGSIYTIPYLCNLWDNGGNDYYTFYWPNDATGVLGKIPYGIDWKTETVNVDGQDKDLEFGYIQYERAGGFWNSLKIARQRQCATIVDENSHITVNTLPSISWLIDRVIGYPDLYFNENHYKRQSDNQPTDIFNANNESILAMLVAFDQYVHYYDEMLYDGAIDWYELNASDPGNQPYYSWIRERLSYCGAEGEVMYLNLSKIWIDEFANRTSPTPEMLKNTLTKIRNKVEAYRDLLRNKNKYIQQFVDDMLAQEIGEDARGKLKIDNIKNIYEKLYNAPSKVNFEEPRILYVEKHWFKDLDFRASYEKQDSEKHIKLDNIGTDELDVTMDLNGRAYTQTKQPYVIKGNSVTLDGEDKTKEYNDITTTKGGKETPDRNGELKILEDAGSGYKAAKKILTQGMYYVYDGTEATSKGVYYNKILEKIKPGQCAVVKILDGRIFAIHRIELNEFNSCNNKPVNVEDCVEVKYVNAETASNAVTYYIKVNKSIEYLSPAQNPYDASVKSAETINKVLDAMGIICKRQPVSFDTVVVKNEEQKEIIYSGDTAMLTAFNVLENMHTESAEHIYRDLKEFLIDLGYYTSAEFEAINTNVLKWFIPSYTPDNPAHWKQNKDSDSIKYGAVIYPIEVDNDTGEVKENGFDVDSDVIAPGNCRIIAVENDKITIEFDGISQPSIGLVNGYTMIISGVKPEETITTKNGEISIADAIANKTVIEGGTTIALTLDKKIIVVFMDNKGAYISTVEDYMAPNVNTVDVGDLGYFYYIPYESGAGGAGTVGGRNGNEVAVGICQWTVLVGSTTFNNISPLCEYLYNQDPVLCKELKTFINWNESNYLKDYFSSNSQLVKAFETVCNRDKDKFTALQMQYAIDEKTRIAENAGVSWIMKKNPVTAGTYFSLINWYPAGGWESQINESMSDEQIIIRLLKHACPIGSTAGTLEARWESQARLAIEILRGEFTDIEDWLANPGNYPQYGSGANRGYLLK